MKGKDLLLGATIVLGSILCVKAAQVALTPDLVDALGRSFGKLLESSGVGFLLVVTAILFLLSCAAAAWHRAEQRSEREAAARVELRAKGWAVVPESIDASSLLDDSESGHLPDEWRAHCGELVHLPSPNNGGPRAA